MDAPESTGECYGALGWSGQVRPDLRFDPVTVPEFTCDPSENTYEQVADHIAALIATGELSPGAMLPNERQLAAEYGVSVGTVRRASELLERRGLIKIRRSKGKFVLRDDERQAWKRRDGAHPNKSDGY